MICFANVLKLPHWTSASPCWECDCKKEPMPAGKCVKTIRPSLQRFVLVDSKTAAEMPASQHPIFSIPGVTSRIVRGDPLHILFTKGIYADLLGSILHYLCWKEGPGRVQTVSPCKRLGLIFEQVQKVYRDNATPTRLTNLKLSMFVKESAPHAQFPFLKSKGAECKHLAPALLHVCKLILDANNPVDQQIVSALESMCTLVEVYDQCGMFLSEADHRTALQKAEMFLDSYDWLQKWALSLDRKLFHAAIKFHTFWHLVQNSKYLNPRFHWCFKSEDFVGRISRLTHSVSMAVKSTRLSLKVVPKYKLLLHLRLTRNDFSYLGEAEVV